MQLKHFYSSWSRGAIFCKLHHLLLPSLHLGFSDQYVGAVIGAKMINSIRVRINGERVLGASSHELRENC